MSKEPCHGNEFFATVGLFNVRLCHPPLRNLLLSRQFRKFCFLPGVSDLESTAIFSAVRSEDSRQAAVLAEERLLVREGDRVREHMPVPDSPPAPAPGAAAAGPFQHAPSSPGRADSYAKGVRRKEVSSRLSLRILSWNVNGLHASKVLRGTPQPILTILILYY